MYRYYKKKNAVRRRATLKRSFKRGFRRAYTPKKSYRPYRKFKSVNPKIKVPNIKVPIAFSSTVALSTSADKIFTPEPTLKDNEVHDTYTRVYNKHKVVSIVNYVQPHQYSSYYYNLVGNGEPLKYVVYKITPDTLGDESKPTNFREAMAMPGARAYSLTRSSKRMRIAQMGVVNTYLKGSEFVDANLTNVRQSRRATYIPTNTLESDLPWYFGFRIWFPQLTGGTLNLPPPSFEVISVLNVSYIMPTNASLTTIKKEDDTLPDNMFNLNCNSDCIF
ncbi:hypothetical protein [Circovirus-like genome CB-A]|uniref:Capsid protein n=1 Tax=Circovirus-like genome CB-A TaxID=642256 RepID=C6GII6_9VIRU|nr:hypothetical protein [Circovirus-like genome CB-A]ACQ78167.1 hypothetical protein [Circovirus-like genome CB-A]